MLRRVLTLILLTAGIKCVVLLLDRAPLQVVELGAANYLEYFRDMRAHIMDLYDIDVTISEKDCGWLHESYGLRVTPDWKSRITFTKRLLFNSSWWCYVLLLCPWFGLLASGIFWRSGHFIYVSLLTVLSILSFLPACMFLIPHVRYLHPLSFAIFLIVGTTICFGPRLVHKS